MSLFRHRPIKQQFTLVNLITAAVALVLVSSVLFGVQVMRMKTGFERQLSAMVEIMAHGLQSALLAQDREAAMNALEAFSALPEVTGATLYLGDHSVLAGFHPGGEGVSANVFVKHSFIVEGSHCGSLEIQANDRHAVWDLLGIYATIIVCTLVAALLVAFLLSRSFEHLVADPVLELAAVARRIESDHDYAVRAQTSGSDEVEVLTEAFNRMLDRIENKDRELQTARACLEAQLLRLEEEIEERKRIQVEQSRLAAIVEATPDFIGSCDRNGEVFYLNKAARTTLEPEDSVGGARLSVQLWSHRWNARLASRKAIRLAMKQGSWVGETRLRGPGGRVIQTSQVIIAHKDASGILEYFSTILRDITPILEAEEALRESQQRLVESSRRAGMADIATAVLHNVGNVLNSVNVSAGLVKQMLNRSRIPNVQRTARLMTAQNGGLGEFLTRDDRGRHIPSYLESLGGHLLEERDQMVGEVDQLARNIEHIKEVVAMQQNYAKVSGATETVSPRALVEEALAMHAVALREQKIETEVVEVEPVDVHVDRHRVLQILVNLLTNAIQALDRGEAVGAKTIGIRIQPVRGGEGGERVEVDVVDNGVGIAAGNLDRIFSHGFTTRPRGHGFGLHSAALAARQVGGALSVYSAGIGAGARFRLSLPIFNAVSSR